MYKVDFGPIDQTADADLDFAASEGVTITIATATGGYTATAAHAAITTACYVTVGDSPTGITCST